MWFDLFVYRFANQAYRIQWCADLHLIIYSRRTNVGFPIIGVTDLFVAFNHKPNENIASYSDAAFLGLDRRGRWGFRVAAAAAVLAADKRNW